MIKIKLKEEIGIYPARTPKVIFQVPSLGHIHCPLSVSPAPLDVSFQFDFSSY